MTSAHAGCDVSTEGAEIFGDVPAIRSADRLVQSGEYQAVNDGERRERPWFCEDGSQDREMWQRAQDGLNRIVGTSSSIK